MIIPANKLADFIVSQTPEQRTRIVRETRKGGADHPNYYACFHKPAREFLLGGAQDATSILRVIDHLKTRTKSNWYVIDSRVTTEALRSLITCAPAIYSLGITFAAPGKNSRAKLRMPDAEVVVTPNLIVHGERNGKPLLGAMRFFLAKEKTYQLGPRRAELVAVMMHLWLVQNASGQRAPESDLCLVLECVQQRITKAPTDISKHIASIERGCREFARVWHLLDEQEAA